MGFNIAGDAKVRKWLPGVRLSWSLPHFAFLNTDITGYIDDSSGVDDGGVPSETDSFMVDVNWALPIAVKKYSFSVEGHVEYIGSRINEFGQDIHWWILSKRQFRFDLGKLLFSSSDKLFIGIEWQIWINKLGDDNTDENAVQALIVWRL
jgi:hypothetical protein